VKVIADTSKCIAAGTCVLTAPELFDQDDDGLVVMVNAHPSEAERSAAREAASLCPSNAIALEE
jgi:ferredoxin